MEDKQKIACLAHLGDYDVPIGMFIERCLGYKTIKCPATTKKTVETGSKNSPDTVCTPFKIILGNYIDAIAKGANVLVVPAIGCRLGFYDVLQKQILSDLGYNIEVLNLFEYSNYTANPNKIYRALCDHNPVLTLEQFTEVLNLVAKIVVDMDTLADSMRKNMAFELTKGEHEKAYRQYLNEVKGAQNLNEAEDIGNKYKELFSKIKINKPEKPLRIGLVGDLYSVMEPHGNCYIESWLAENKVEIIRPVTLTYLAKTLFNPDGQIAVSGGYTHYYIGGNATGTVALAYQMAQDGLDGIIHMKAATCSPEITAMSVLQNISKEHNIPIVYLTFDTETSEAGLHTRLEAFKDMLVMKRRINK